jgi:dipeptidyl aminopeptidase/acylaminoacyl peptidase
MTAPGGNMNRRHILSLLAALPVLAVRTQALAQAAADTPPKATDAIPPRPAIDLFARLPQIDQIRLSPSGKRIALITQKGDQKLLVYFTVGKSDKKLVPLGKIKVRDLLFGDDDHVVIISSMATDRIYYGPGKAEVMLATSFNLNTHEFYRFFDKIKDTGDTATPDEGTQAIWYYQRVKVNGEVMIAAGNVGGDGDLYGFRGDKGSVAKKLMQVDAYDLVMRPDGHPLAYARYDRTNAIWSLYYNISPPGTAHNFKFVMQETQKVFLPSLEGMGRTDDKVLLWHPNEDSGILREFDASGFTSDDLYPGDKSVAHSALFHPVTGCFAGFQLHHDWTENAYFDPKLKGLNDLIPQALGDGYHGYAVGYSDDMKTMLLYVEGKDDPGSYYTIDLAAGSTEFIAENYPGIPAAWLSSKTAISFKASDGLDIPGFLTLPPNKQPAVNLPLVVLPHGGPHARDYADFDWMAQCLAAQGYAVLQPNFRGSSGYTRAFLDAGNGQWGRKMQTDLSDGVRELARRGVIDKSRVAILGVSYGGYAALAGATLDPGVYRCAIAISGISDVGSHLEWEIERAGDKWNPQIRYIQLMLGDQKDFEPISPARQADKAYCPILLIHGTDDSVVDYKQSQRMDAALTAAGKPHAFITLQGQDHWETVGSARIDMMNNALAFLEKYNPA